MAGPTDPLAEAMSYWGVIQRSASLHEGAAAAVQRVAQEAARLGEVPSFQVYGEAMRLYGQATALQYGTEHLSAAGPEVAGLGQFVERLPYGSGLVSPAGPPVYHVRVEYSAIRNGEPVGDYVTLRYTGGLPGTVGELREDARVVTEGLVTGYGSRLTGIGDIQIGQL